MQEKEFQNKGTNTIKTLELVITCFCSQWSVQTTVFEEYLSRSPETVFKLRQNWSSSLKKKWLVERKGALQFWTL